MKRVLVAIDGSRHSDKAMKEVKDLLRLTDNQLQVTLLHITDIPNNLFNPDVQKITPSAFEQMASEQVDLTLNSAREYFEMDGYSVNTMAKFGSPASIICEVAQYEGYDLIVVGSRGLGAVKGLFMGSVSSKVAHLANCPVLIVK